VRTELADPIRSLAYATDVDVLDEHAVVVDRGDHVVVRSPNAPTYHWGNFLLWRRAPERGDRVRWEAAFEREFEGAGCTHLLFAWDTVDAEAGAMQEEFADHGYSIDRVSALVADPASLRTHPRASTARVRRLDPAADGRDEDAWAQVFELQLANRDPGHTEVAHRAYLAQVTAARRSMFAAGRAGGWYVAELDDGTVVASCGIVVTEGRGRFQSVDARVDHRRQGHATRLVEQVGRDAIERHGAGQLVIVAEEGYHAKGLYESLGFVELHRSLAACWWPTAPNAAQHPRLGATSPPR
jgi:ribosomal protein S18 acetylase RimI-like enzyme